jgi:hypothetical protein
MYKPTEFAEPIEASSPSQRYQLPEHSAMASERSLLRRNRIDQVRDAMRLAGSTSIATLLSDAERHADYLQKCVKEAEAVLRGSLEAANRLWLLLRQPVESSRSIPSSILKWVAGDSWQQSPNVMDGDVLLRLIAGVVRAANQPREADAMLDALARLLQPLLHVEVAAAAAERARVGDRRLLETFDTAHSASKWRAALRPADPVIRPELLRSPSETLDTGRASYDRASWLDEAIKPSIDPWDWGWPCMGNARKSMSEIDRFGPRYTIDSIDRPDACPGTLITLRGKNFGRTGRVTFPSPHPGDPQFALAAGDPGVTIGVVAKRWTDTEIAVVVPAWATAGELSLGAFTRHEDHCTTIDVYRLGNGIFFGGGLASVYQVSIAGVNVDFTSTQPTNLAPNDGVAITWHASGGPTAVVGIKLIESGNVRWQSDAVAGGFGGTVMTVPDVGNNKPIGAMLVFTATSACGATQPLTIPVWISVKPHLTITYVEVTQGVQRDLADVLAGRAMPTVAYKDTAVRVHLACDRGGWFFDKLDKITGALLIGGNQLAPTNSRVLERGFAAITGQSNPDLTNDTLNFTIPAAWLPPGPHSLTVKIVCNDPSGKITLAQSIVWNWVAKRALPVRAIYMKSFSGSDEFLLDYARRALDMLPTPLTDIGIAAPRWMGIDHDLREVSGWIGLLFDLEDAWDDADEASGVRWLGVIPDSIEDTGGTSGISGTPSIAVLAREDMTDAGAHELGHSLGLNHVNLPVGLPAGPYEPATDNGGFLRRAAFDVRPSTAVGLPAGDLMSYQRPVRPGISSWSRLLDEI